MAMHWGVASLSKPEQQKQLQSTSSPAGTGQAPTSLHMAMHWGVASIISARRAIFFETAARCFSDSAHASVAPKSESAEAATTRNKTRMNATFAYVSEKLRLEP